MATKYIVTIMIIVAALNAIIDTDIAKYDHHERNGDSWQTTHFSVYNLKNELITLSSQENNRVFEFRI